MARTLTPAEQDDVLARYGEMVRRGYFTPGADHGLTHLQLRDAHAWRDRMRERGYLPPVEPSESRGRRAPKLGRSRVPHWPGLENLARLSEEDRRDALARFMAADSARR